MTVFRTLLPAAVLALVAATSFAQQSDSHTYHPGGAASSAPRTKPSPPAGMHDMGMMDAHMKAMRQMHEKMAAAKAQSERDALVADHMKLMQEGMSMMDRMSPGKSPANPASRQQMMEKRMEMMQMMMDRMPMSPPPASK
jgi:hypothetical protein